MKIAELYNDQFVTYMEGKSEVRIYNNESNLVVTSENGKKPVNPRNLLRQFYELIEDAKVPKISFHDFRQTHATIMMEQGENPKVVKERLGHSRVGVTLDLYSYVSDDLQAEAAYKFEETLFKRE